MKIITSWRDFEEWRHTSIEYHRRNEYRYINALNYFEYARRYFDCHDWPEQNHYKNGNVKPFTNKESEQQRKDIQEWIIEQKSTKKSKRKKVTKNK